jgi:hypothetical protein
VETAGVEPASSSVQARCSAGGASSPGEVRTGGVEPPQPEAAGLQPVELSRAQRPREWGDRPDLNRYCEIHGLGCLPVTPRPPRSCSGDGRARTGGLSPDKRALCSSELRPQDVRWRGWDSNPRLEPMKLARLPLLHRASSDSDLTGRSRTCDLRFPTPAGWPGSPTVSRAPSAGFEPAASGLRVRRLPHFDHEGTLRLRRQGSNLPFASNSRASYRLDHAGLKKRSQQDSNLRAAQAAYALATRCLARLGHGSR